MGIEPIGSAMTYQAQQTSSVKTTEYSEKANKDVAVQENTTVAFDPTTAKIVEGQETDTKGQGRQSGEEYTEAQTQASSEQIKKAVEKLNKSMFNSEAVFGIHEETNRITIKIVDKDTKEVIKELPPEKTLDMIAKAWELAGILVDEKR